MTDWYVLNDDKTVTRMEFEDWLVWMKDEKNRENVEKNRRVASTEWGPFWISTVFLGLDHSYDGAGPMLFETMVFLRWPVEEGDIEMERWATYSEALLGHMTMCDRVKSWQMIWYAACRVPGVIRHGYWACTHPMGRVFSKRWRRWRWIFRTIHGLSRGLKVFKNWLRSFLGEVGSLARRGKLFISSAIRKMMD